MASIPEILLKIKNATVNTLSQVQWPGVNGLREITTDLTDAIKARGTMLVADFAALQFLTGADTQFVWVKEKGLYFFNPNTPSQMPPGSIVATGGGIWELITVPVPHEYNQ